MTISTTLNLSFVKSFNCSTIVSHLFKSVISTSNSNNFTNILVKVILKITSLEGIIILLETTLSLS